MNHKNIIKPNRAFDKLSTEHSNISDIELSAQNLQNLFGGSTDINLREIYINGDNRLAVSLLFIDGLVNHDRISDYILKPIVEKNILSEVKTLKQALKLIQQGAVYYSSQRTTMNISDVITAVTNGDTALIFDKEKTALIFDTKGFEKRPIIEPTTENVAKGSKDSFVETLRTNTATVRRKIHTHDLRIEETLVGTQTRTSIAIIYIEGIANKNLLNEVKTRIGKINIDHVLTTGQIEEYIIDNKYNTFPQIISTERPDKFCSGIVSGRVGIIIDGLPICYVVPGSINEFLHAPEDYSYNFIIASLLRLLRYANAIATLLLPGLFVAFVTFNQEMLPTDLALSIQSSKEGVPFPTAVEVILMLIAFETLLEAGFRLPKAVGQTVAIVGALVVGQTAVNAKLISQTVVVVIAITAIASFVMTNQDFSNALRVWRFILTILSSLLGIYGLILGLIILLYHLSKLEVFGIPYLSPYVGQDQKQLQDSLFRFPLTFLKKRPIDLKTTNKQRER